VLNFREQDILRSIVRAYIETGEPLGSRTLSKLGSGGSLSAASIRNVMADLADDGYLYQPHTSAGRIPTEKAFKFYVETVADNIKEKPSAQNPRLLAGLRAELNESGDVEGSMQRASRILTEMTRNVGIAAALPATEQELEHIELINLSDRRILMILVTRDHSVRNRVVMVDEAISLEQLQSLRNYVNVNFAGWKLSDARAELLRRLDQERAAYDEVLKHLNVLYQKGLLEVDNNPWLHMEGASNLVGLDLHLTRERMRELFQALEEKKRVLELLDRFMEQSHGELGIHIGLEDMHPSMKELSLIGISIALPGGSLARIAVLGPVRMDYEKVISSVLQIGRAFERAPA
jgi:heat-inducible transcriptional repressor